MPRMPLLEVNDHVGRAMLACDYDADDLRVTALYGESSGGTRTVSITDGTRTDTRTFTGAGSGTVNVRNRGWFLSVGEEGELMVPFSARIH